MSRRAIIWLIVLVSIFGGAFYRYGLPTPCNIYTVEAARFVKNQAANQSSDKVVGAVLSSLSSEFTQIYVRKKLRIDKMNGFECFDGVISVVFRGKLRFG